MREAMRELHFDLAGAPVPQLLQALLSVADLKHIHYGSDYPFTPEDSCSLLAERIASTPILTSANQALIWRDNALALFPRFANRRPNTLPASAVDQRVDLPDWMVGPNSKKEHHNDS
jgi:predicted TIM-barrel fold metal-dependent hydrolase